MTQRNKECTLRTGKQPKGENELVRGLRVEKNTSKVGKQEVKNERDGNGHGDWGKKGTWK